MSHLHLPSRFAFLFFAFLATLSAQTSTLNLSTDLVRLNIAPANLTPNQTALDAGPLLEAGVRYAVTNRLSRVIADTGSYYFLSGSATNPSWHALFPGPTSVPLTIDLQGSDLYFARSDKGGFFVTVGTNLTLQNFTMDYQQQLYTQVLVTAVNAAQRQLQFTVQPGWQNPTALNALLNANGSTETYAYVFRNGQPWVGFTRMPVAQPFSDTSTTIGVPNLISTATLAAIRPGDVAVLQVRGGSNAILAQGLTGSTLRNIKIYAFGSGVRLITSSSSLLERIEVIPRPGTDRLISTVADGIQPQNLGLSNTIRLCRSIRTCDDGFSPASFVFASVQSVASARSVQVQGDVTAVLNTNAGGLPNGSTVVFERPSDGAILGSATLVSQAAATALGGLPQRLLNFDRDLPANLTGAYIYAGDASLRGGGLLMERNTVQQQGWARGISIWGLMNATFSGNYIRRSSFAGIEIQHQLFKGDWLVPPSANLTLTNNVIDGAITGPDYHTTIQLAGIQSVALADTGAPMTTSPHQNITIAANFIADPARSAIWLGHTSGGQVYSNYLFNPNNAPNLALAYAPYRNQELQPLVTEASPDAVVTNNTIDQSSRRAFVTDTGYRELAAYAPGSTIRLNAFNLGAVVSPAISLTDADGKSWPLPVVATATHTLDVQLPATAGLGGAVVTLHTVSASYLGTLFVDGQDNIPALNQATYLVSPSATTVPPQASTLSFLVITQPGSAYSATAADSFVTVGPRNSGTGVVTASLGRNTGAARTTTIEIASQPITLTQLGDADPVIATQPKSQTVTSGSRVVISVDAPAALSQQWFWNGSAVTGANTGVLAIANVQPANAGLYTDVVTTAAGSVTSAASIIGVSSTSKVIGAGDAIGFNITHPNGNIFDQVLLTGVAATITAEGRKVTRTSFIDLSDDIVQVELAGAGTLSIVLDNPSGPAAPLNYNQPTVGYMKGHAGIIVAGADETTNISIFTVGRATAFDPTGRFSILQPVSATNNPTNNGSGLFQGHGATAYDGFASFAFIAISSTNGKFGGLRASNGNCFATKGLTGIYAPGVQFQGPVFIGNITAFDAATPVLMIGSSSDTRITGGDLAQANNQAVKVTGLTQLKYTAGSDSGGTLFAAKTNKGVLQQNGVDVTAQIVVNPNP